MGHQYRKYQLHHQYRPRYIVVLILYRTPQILILYCNIYERISQYLNFGTMLLTLYLCITCLTPQRSITWEVCGQGMCLSFHPILQAASTLENLTRIPLGRHVAHGVWRWIKWRFWIFQTQTETREIEISIIISLFGIQKVTGGNLGCVMDDVALVIYILFKKSEREIQEIVLKYGEAIFFMFSYLLRWKVMFIFLEVESYDGSSPYVASGPHRILKTLFSISLCWVPCASAEHEKYSNLRKVSLSS